MRITRAYYALVAPNILHDQITIEDPVYLEKPIVLHLAYQRLQITKWSNSYAITTASSLTRKVSSRMKGSGKVRGGSMIRDAFYFRNFGGSSRIAPHRSGQISRRNFQPAGALGALAPAIHCETSSKGGIRFDRGRGFTPVISVLHRRLDSKLTPDAPGALRCCSKGLRPRAKVYRMDIGTMLACGIAGDHDAASGLSRMIQTAHGGLHGE
jgi:hypothetical protein